MKLFRILPIAIVAVVVAAIAPAAGAATPQIATNWYQTCVLSDAGTVSCAGDNANRSLGDLTVGTRPAFAAGPALTGVTRLAAVETAVCALLADTTVMCWGDDSNGQLGRDGTGSDSATPATVLQAAGVPLAGVTQIATQYNTVCVRKVDATAWCWGQGAEGQIGDGGTSDRTMAVQVAGLPPVEKIVPGDYHTCALVSGGEVYCWGSDSSGALGNGGGGDNPNPTKVGGLSGVVDIGGGYNYGCALIDDGTVKCWGEDLEGQQGNGPGETDNLIPTLVPGVAGAVQLAVGYETVCVRDAAFNVMCWGLNGQYEVSGPGTDNVDSPMAVPALAGAIDLAQQWDETGCALYRGGGIKCWGSNSHGQIGVDNGLADTPVPLSVPGVDLVTLPYPASAASLAQAGKSKLDKKKKTYTVTTQLTATPNPLVAPAEACTGLVTASTVRTWYVKKTIKRKGKKVKKKVKKTKTYKRNGMLTQVGDNCVATVALKLSVKFFNGKRVKITQTAAGNGSLLATSANRTVKLPKVKTKKKTKKKK